MAHDIPHLFNELSNAHDGQGRSFDFQLDRSAWEIAEVRRIIREEKDPAQGRLDEIAIG